MNCDFGVIDARISSQLWLLQVCGAMFGWCTRRSSKLTDFIPCRPVAWFTYNKLINHKRLSSALLSLQHRFYFRAHTVSRGIPVGVNGAHGAHRKPINLVSRLGPLQSL